MRLSPLRATALALLCPLASCVGEIDISDEELESPDVNPAYGLFDPPVGGQTMNGIAFSALTTDPEAVTRLLSYPLASETYTRDAEPGDPMYDFLLRASEPETVVFFDYLVKCALRYEQEPVKRKNPVDSNDITVHQGAMGFCPQWAEGAVIDDSACTQKVSACLLSLVNELDTHVALSMRAIDGSGEPIKPTSNAVPKTEGVDAFDYCYSPAYGPDAACGWEPGLVGTCQPGKEVIIRKPGGCGTYGPYDSRRVCKGVFGCDIGDYNHIASNWTCYSPDIRFTCPEEGAYSVMTRTLYGSHRDRTTLRSPVGGAGAAYFPASERLVYRFKEGGFWGEIFDPSGDSVSILTRVRLAAGSNTIIKELSDDGGITWRTQLPPDPNRVIYQEMYACHSAMWDFYTVFDLGRVCAGSTGWGCAANHVGNCERRGAHEDPDSVLITIEEGACAYDDAPPVTGDSDYGKCNDQEEGRDNDTWEHVVTTFLVHPCDLWGPASTARETCLENQLPPVPRPIRPRPLPIGGVLVNR